MFKIPIIFFLFLFLSSAAACDRCIHKSMASSFPPSSSQLTAGACGYASTALQLNQAYIAAANPSLYRAGIGCGACYQIRCRNSELCTKTGVKIVITDSTNSNTTDFVLSKPAFSSMAFPAMAAGLNRVGIVGVEYKRIPCEYPNRNLSVRVEESSRKPSLLTVKLLYQGGQTDIMGVDVARVGSPGWQFMTRSNGPVWTTNRAPVGPLQFRFVVTGGYDGKWVWARREVLPVEWEAGEVYDTGVQISEIALEGCGRCDAGEWR